MKKKNLAVALVVLAVVIVICVVVAAVAGSSGKKYTYKQGDFLFERNGSVTALTKYSGSDSVVKVPNEIEGFTVNKIGEEAFADNTTMTEVTLGSGVEEIGDRAFYGCTALKTARLQDGIKEIGDNAFNGCTSLTSVRLPKACKRIGVAAFYGCTRLNAIEYTFDEDAKYAVVSALEKIGAKAFYKTSLGQFIVPEGVTEIGESAFYGTTNLQKVIFAGSALKDISDFCFTNTGTTFSVSYYDDTLSPANATDIWSYAQPGLPEGLETIGERAFGNVGYTSVRGLGGTLTLGSSIKSVGPYAFATTRIRSIIFENDDVLLQEGAFYGCTNITSANEVSLPANLAFIADKLFMDCSSMGGVTIPKSVKAIGVGAFAGCVGSSFSIAFESGSPLETSYKFVTDSHRKGLYSADGKVLYSLHESGTASNINLLDVEEIRPYALSKANMASEDKAPILHIADTVKKIYSGAFEGCLITRFYFEHADGNCDIDAGAFGKNAEGITVLVRSMSGSIARELESVTGVSVEEAV